MMRNDAVCAFYNAIILKSLNLFNYKLDISFFFILYSLIYLKTQKDFNNINYYKPVYAEASSDKRINENKLLRNVMKVSLCIL